MFTRFKYFFAAVLAAVIWGFFSIVLRDLKAYDSSEILNYRIFTSLILIWISILFFRNKELKTDISYIKLLPTQERKRLFLLIFLSAIFITGNWFTFIYAVNHVSLKSAAFAYMVCPLLTAIGGFTILKENVTKLKIIGISVAFVSIILLGQGSLLDVIWSVSIALLYAFYLIIQRVISQFDKFNLLGIQLIISTLIIFPIFLYQLNGIPTDLSFWLHIIIIAVFFTIIPLLLSLYALNGLPSSTMGIIIYVNPIIAFIVAIFYFGEKIVLYEAVAYSLLFFAVLIFNWEIVRALFFRKMAIKA